MFHFRVTLWLTGRSPEVWKRRARTKRTWGVSETEGGVHSGGGGWGGHCWHIGKWSHLVSDLSLLECERLTMHCRCQRSDTGGTTGLWGWRVLREEKTFASPRSVKMVRTTCSEETWLETFSRSPGATVLMVRHYQWRLLKEDVPHWSPWSVTEEIIGQLWAGVAKNISFLGKSFHVLGDQCHDRRCRVLCLTDHEERKRRDTSSFSGLLITPPRFTVLYWRATFCSNNRCFAHSQTARSSTMEPDRKSGCFDLSLPSTPLLLKLWGTKFQVMDIIQNPSLTMMTMVTSLGSKSHANCFFSLKL